MVIQHNFIELIKAGVFNETPDIEPMSPWKWRQVMLLAERHGVGKIMAKSIEKEHDNPRLNISDAVIRMLSDEEHVSMEMVNMRSSDVEYLNDMLLTPMPLTFDIENISLLTGWKQRRLQRIKDNERHAIDTSIETIRLLNIIVANVAMIEQYDLSLLYVLTLGHYLRTQGHRVDFVKLEAWLAQLRVQRLTSLLCSILIDVFSFSQDELPFFQRYDKDGARQMHRYIQSRRRSGHLRHTVQYFRYTPMGMLSYWTSLTHDSLSKIEE